MTAVDTGWITDERPHPTKVRLAEEGFHAPLDLVDGAARVYDPIVRGEAGEDLYGCFLKDYAAGRLVGRPGRYAPGAGTRRALLVRAGQRHSEGTLAVTYLVGYVQHMDAVLQALADESRRTVLEILRDHPATAGELADALPIARPGVSRHLRVLREAGLVDVRQEAQRRIYSLRPEALVEVDEWLEEYRALWQNRLDALHTEIARGKKAQTMSIIGTMRALDETRGAVRVEDVYDTDIDDLWQACTTPERLARWIAEVSGDLRVGGTIHAVFTSTLDRSGAGRGLRRTAPSAAHDGAGHGRRGPDRGLAHRGGIPDQAGGRGARPAGRPAPLLRSRLAGPPGGPRTFACERRPRPRRRLVGADAGPGLARALDRAHP